MNAREDAARRLPLEPANTDLARRWVAASYLVAQANSCSSTAEIVSRPLELLPFAEKAIRLSDRLEALRKNNLEVLKDGTLVYTEKERLREVPSSVRRGITAEIGEGWTALDGLEKLVGNEVLYPVGEVIAAETLSRTMSEAFHKRLAPDLNSASKTTVFSGICASIAAFVAFTIGAAFRRRNGILPVSEKVFEFIKKNLEEKFGKPGVAWFFHLMSTIQASKLDGLAYSTLVRDSFSQLTYVPYHSLIMLSLISFKFTISKKLGTAANYKGSAIEDLLYNGVTASLQTKHPKNTQKLLRYQLPGNNGDIDVAGFNETNLVLLEAKFWDSPTIASLELELSKFEHHIEYVQTHLADLGFDKRLKIISIFFTPYAPLPKWHDIILLPSISSIISFLLTTFGPRPFTLIVGDDKIRQFVQADTKEHFMAALDGSKISPDIDEDIYRIQDGAVAELEDTELAVYVMAPSGRTYPIFCEINDKVATDLRSSGVGPGTVIRMGLYNLLGGWAPTQLCSFRVLKSSEETKGQSPEWTLILENASSAPDEFVLRTWGDELGKEILDFIHKWHVDFPKFLVRLEQKGQNYLSGVGVALSFQDKFDHVEQCSCGDLMGLPKQLADQLRALSSDGKLKCKFCDTELESKIRNLSGGTGGFLDFADLVELASKKEKSAKEPAED